MKKNIVVLIGAGISAESGINTLGVPKLLKLLKNEI